MLHFNDGISIPTDGKYRIHRAKDGLYVVGHGSMEAVADMQEAREVIEDLRKLEDEMEPYGGIEARKAALARGEL